VRHRGGGGRASVGETLGVATFVSNSYDFAQSFFRFCPSAQLFCVFLSDFVIPLVIL
jgi:hypothetical protein